VGGADSTTGAGPAGNYVPILNRRLTHWKFWHGVDPRDSKLHHAHHPQKIFRPGQIAGKNWGEKKKNKIRGNSGENFPVRGHFPCVRKLGKYAKQKDGKKEQRQKKTPNFPERGYPAKPTTAGPNYTMAAGLPQRFPRPPTIGNRSREEIFAVPPAMQTMADGFRGWDGRRLYRLSATMAVIYEALDGKFYDRR